MRWALPLLLASACLAGEAGDLAKAVLDPKDWEVREVPGTTVPAKPGEDAFCDAKDVSSRDGALVVHSVGKSSHRCDAPTQIAKAVEVPRSLRLRFGLTADHVRGEAAWTGLRVLQEGRTVLAVPMRAGPQEFLLLTDGPTKAELVLDTTCRAAFFIGDAVAEPFECPKLDDAKAKRIEALLPDLAREGYEVRVAASKGLADLLGGKDGIPDMGVYERIRAAARESKDPEAKSRLAQILDEGSWRVADLRDDSN